MTRRLKNCMSGWFVLFMIASGSTDVQAQLAPATPNTCYATTGQRDGGRLLSLDRFTGAATLIAAIPGLGRASGLAIDSNGNMFVSDALVPSNLYRIDAVTGAATLVGNTGIVGLDGIAFDKNDVLYGAETGFQDKLYTFNTTTGAPTLIGTMGAARQIAGLAFDPTTGVLYGSTGGSGITVLLDILYTINTATGVATAVGPNGLGNSTPDIFFDGDGQLFGSKGGGSAFGNLIAINKGTGAGSVIGPFGFQSVSGLDCFQLSPPGPVPTMGKLGLIVLGLLVLSVASMRLRKRRSV